MSKVKAAARHNHAGMHHQIEFDDNPLPPSEELAKYKSLDDDIINWIKLRADKEQSSRLKIQECESNIRDKGVKRRFQIDMSTLIFAFIIILGGMALTYLLIMNDKPIAGGIFGGVTLLAAARAFLNFRKPKITTRQVAN